MEANDFVQSPAQYRSSNKEISTISYSPLDEDRDEIRLITFTNESIDSGLVHCNLETVSLKSYNSEYQAFISALGSAVSKRKVIGDWARTRRPLRCSEKHGQDIVDNHVPAVEDYRFLWGDYAALSYVWGDENMVSKIVVNRRETRVTRNLEIAMRALCKRPDFHAGYKLWVDAICINQADNRERQRQISKMQSIYGSAWAVVAWLGEEADESGKAIDLIEALANVGRGDRGQELEAKLKKEPGYLGDGGWLALHEFMQRPYWTRLWIIQEIVLGSSEVVIRCGNKFIDWPSFCLGIGVLFNYLWMVKDMLLERDLDTRGMDVDPRWITGSLHLVYKDLRVMSQYEERGGERLSFGRLLDVAHSASSRDIRDKVYGLVGMMDPVITQQLAPTYETHPSRIFASVAKAFILTYGNLEPIREGNPWGKTNTPSWAADWTWNGRLRYARIDIPVWGPFWAQDTIYNNPYRASGETRPEVSFSDDDSLLTCKGFLIDTVSGLTAREFGYFSWQEESIEQPDHWKSVYGDANSTAQALYHTLVADRVGDEQRASGRHAAILSLPSTFKAAIPQFKRLGWKWLADQEGYYFRWEEWRRTNRRFQLGDRRLDDYFTNRIPDGASEYDYTEVFSCFDRTCKGRRFMTTSMGHLGWAPDNVFGNNSDQTRKGDLIAIIFGCSTPIVVRPHGKLFQVLGEAYVQGLMDGEAMKLLESKECAIQEFTFC